MHQMEENGPRFFVPPNTDPIDLNYDPLIWRSAALLGDAMAHGTAARRPHGRAVEREVRLLLARVRRFRAARPQHGVSADRSGERRHRLADYRDAERAPRGIQGAERLPSANQFSAALARRALDASRHRRLRPERRARSAVCDGGLPRAARSELLRHGSPRRRSGRARRALCVHHPARPARPLHDGQARKSADRWRDRNSSRAGTVSRRRRAVSGGHRHHLSRAAVSRVCEDAARTAELSRSSRDGKRASRSPVRRRRLDACRSRWA